jgi:hypothetical protein
VLAAANEQVFDLICSKGVVDHVSDADVQARRPPMNASVRAVSRTPALEVDHQRGTRRGACR